MAGGRMVGCVLVALGLVLTAGTGTATASEYEQVLVVETSAVDTETGESYLGRVPLVLEAGTGVLLSYTLLEPGALQGSSHRLEAILEPGAIEMYPAPFFGSSGGTFEYEFVVPEQLEPGTSYRLTIRTAPGLGDVNNYTIGSFGFETPKPEVEDELVQWGTPSTTAPRPTPPSTQEDLETKATGADEPDETPADEDQHTGESEPAARSTASSAEDPETTEGTGDASSTAEPSTAASYVSASGSGGQAAPPWLWSALLAAFGAGVVGLVVAAIVRRARRNASYRRLAARP